MSGKFPTIRPRRLRSHPLLRELVRETTLSVGDLIFPLFVRHGQGIRKEIASMPGTRRRAAVTWGWPPLRGPLLKTATRGCTVLMRTGLLLMFSPWCVTW